LEALKVIGVWVLGIVQIVGADSAMMFGGMMLGKVVGAAQNALAPKDVKLILADAITNLIKSHVHRFGTFLLDSVVGNANGCGIVRL